MKQLIQKWLSVILVCVLAFVNIGGVGHLRIEAMEDTNYQNWLTNYLESNQAIENYFAYYTDTKDNIVFPEYFAGFKVCEDGSLTMFVTSDSLCLREDVKKICNLNELTFIATKYSFSELSQAIEALDDDFMSENGIKAATICIPENQVNVYYYDLSSYNRDAFSGMPFDCYNVIQYTSEKDMAYTTVFPDGNIYSAPQADIALNSETYTQKGILATTLKYGEYGYSGSIGGTVGYLGLSSSGNKILITHGHDLSSGSTYYYNGTAVGTVSVLGTSNHLDAAVVTLYSSTTLTNYASWNSTIRFQSSASTYSALTSISGNTAYFRGQGSGYEKSGTIYYVYSGGTYTFYLVDGLLPYGGDSGAPVYTKTSSTSYKVLGIIKGYETGMATFTSIPAIKDAYSHYVFLNNTSYS